MKKTAKLLFLIILMGVLIGAIYGCTPKYDVTIFSSMENIRNEKLVEILKAEFPDLKIDVQYISSGNNAAKVKAEGTQIAADIVMDIDYAYLQSLSDAFCDVSDIIDLDLYEENLIVSEKFIPLCKFSVAVIVNTNLVAEADYPTNYEDLLLEKYRDKIVMPSPVASGTGYAFLKGMVEKSGEDAAFRYFNDLEKNIKKFTTSGSGPVNELVRGEAAIGIGMVYQAVQQINEGAPLRVLNGIDASYNLSGAAIIKGKQQNENVVKVFQTIVNKFTPYDLKYFLPEKLFKTQDAPDEIAFANYPEINNMNMGIFSADQKESLLNRWKNENIEG